MSLPSLLENLWSDVVGSSAKSCATNCLHVPTSYQQRSEAEIANLGVHLSIQKDVSHFQITVNDSFVVHVLDGASDLNCVEANFGLSETLPSLNHIHERTIRANFENQVCALVERKGAEEFDNVLLPHLGMYLELGLELDSG